MNRARNFGCAVTAKAPRKRECPEEVPHAFLILAHLWVDFRIGSLQISIRDHRWRSVARTGNVNHVESMFSDRPVQVNPGERLSGIRTPVPQQTLLEMLRTQDCFEERIVTQVDHAGAKIIASMPIRIDLSYFIRTKRLPRFLN